MSLSGWRPAVVSSPSSRNRLPAFGPRMTRSRALPGGRAPNDAESGYRSSPRSSSVRPSEIVEVVSPGRPGRHPGPGRHRRGQLGPAVRAEPGPIGIRPAAPGAVDAWHGFARPPLVVLVVFERSSPRYARGGGAVHAPREQPAPSAPTIF